MQCFYISKFNAETSSWTSKTSSLTTSLDTAWILNTWVVTEISSSNAMLLHTSQNELISIQDIPTELFPLGQNCIKIEPMCGYLLFRQKLGNFGGKLNGSLIFPENPFRNCHLSRKLLFSVSLKQIARNFFVPYPGSIVSHQTGLK